MIVARHATLNSQQTDSQTQESKRTRETREHWALPDGFSKVVDDDPKRETPSSLTSYWGRSANSAPIVLQLAVDFLEVVESLLPKDIVVMRFHKTVVVVTRWGVKKCALLQYDLSAI